MDPVKPVYVDDHDNADWIKRAGRTPTSSGPLELDGDEVNNEGMQGDQT